MPYENRKMKSTVRRAKVPSVPKKKATFYKK